MSFDILDPAVNVQRNLLIEASAGTGKTFAIENLFVRLLQEPFNGELSSLNLDQIGVMTFTKAAARDLKKRIRSNIARQKAADPRLQDALYAFDQAQIYTIHGFCSRSLKMFSFEGGLSFDRSGEEQVSPREALRQIVHDAFRMKLKRVHPVQMTLLVQKRGYNQQTIEEDLIKLLEKRGDIVPPPSLQELFRLFQEGISALRSRQILTPFEDYRALLPCLKKKEGEKGVLCLEALLQKGELRFQDFVDFLPHWEGLQSFLDPKNRYKREKPLKPLLYPSLTDELNHSLKPVMELAANPNAIQAALAVHCQELFRKWEERNSAFSPDKLLTEMQKNVQDPVFAEKVRSRYRAIIVDEFQDTDPVQWDILKTLFLSPAFKGFIYLVGDPKQAIYAFRQGDVYTYLAAAQALGAEASVTLSTNYRSSSRLIDALNTLFGAAQSLFVLPRTQGEIPYQVVQAGRKGTLPDDKKGAIHFMECERGSRESLPPALYEAIAQEITQLSNKSIAILVNSAHQGEKMGAALKEWGIPFFSQKPPLLSASPVLKALTELLQAVANPRHLSSLKIALGGMLLGWDLQQVQQLDQAQTLEKQLIRFYDWQGQLTERGFAFFLQSLLKEASTRLLEREGGEAIFQNLMQIGQILTEHQAKTHCTVSGLIEHLQELALQGEEGVRQLLRTEGSVQIVTIHSSKGLEYDIVFAPGVLAAPVKGSEKFIGDEKGEFLHPVLDPEQDNRLHNYTKEMEGERLRLLYVALTRAKERVYIPICFAKKGESPLDLFLGKLTQPLHALLSENITLEKIQGCAPLNKPSRHPIELIPPFQVIVPGMPKVLHSFSSLAQTLEHETPSFAGAPSDYQAAHKTIHNLPAGSETGNLFHALFEKIPFSAPLKEIVEAASGSVRQTRLKGWEEVIGQAIYKTFNTPLPLRTGECSLARMENPACYREMEFCYPYQDGYLKGIIDLIFFHEGIYYLLDWKSNWLGKDSDSYAQEHLVAAMDLHNYSLQAAVYRNALESYLSRVDPRPFDQIYGGMLYLFFRGMDPSNRDQKGIFKL